MIVMLRSFMRIFRLSAWIARLQALRTKGACQFLRATGSRTIVNSRNLAELSYEAFVKQLTLYRETNQEEANKPVWLHFEGRNLEEVERMMLFVRESMPAAKISVEIEALRNDWGSARKLISLADYAFISKDYVREKLGFQSAEPFLKEVGAEQGGSELTHHAKALICPWGAEGVYYLDMPGSEMHQVPATRLDKVVETIGAGDSFIGASLAGFARGNLPFDVVLKTACEVASAKCSKHGFALSAENQTTWRKTFRGEGGSVGAYVA